MEALVGSIVGLAAIVLGQFSLLWYKMGKLEGKVKSLCNHLNCEEKKE